MLSKMLVLLQVQGWNFVEFAWIFCSDMYFEMQS